VTCRACGREEPTAPLTWSWSTVERGSPWLCDTCSRDNVRAIEGRLDEAWW
jgi:hypothetical protein